MFTQFRVTFARHSPFLSLFALFITFRLLALLLFRPGGLIADASDYDFYYAWGQQVPRGYTTYVDLWTAYPPLFPALMLPLFELSSRIPPWVEPRLFFHLLFGLELLLFESGNFLLISRLAEKLGYAGLLSQEVVASQGRGVVGSRGRGVAESRGRRVEESDKETGRQGDRETGRQGDRRAVDESPLHPVILSSCHPVTLSSCHPVILYTLLFTPVFTLIGWFEAMPLFFMLLGLDLLLAKGRWGWVGSAVAAALGFLTKLTPALLAPIAVRWLGGKLSWRAARTEWFNWRAPGNLLRPMLYLLLFVGIIVGVGYPLMHGNTTLAFSSLRINSIRPPWQSVWALLDGYWGYGEVPLSMRNLEGLSRQLWESQLPWGWISVGFGLVYLWLYTRRYDWSQPRTAVAFAAMNIIWLFLYSKGWSPQFLVWVLAFLVLLLPTLRGVAIAIALSIVNVVESHIFLILLPNEHWLLVATVLIRTSLLLLLFLEFLGQIWPQPVRGQQLRQVSGMLTWLLLLGALVGAGLGVPRLAQAYNERRLAEHPCREAVELLHAQAEWPNPTLVTDQIEVWHDFYPWLYDEYSLRVVDGYNPQDRPAEEVEAERIAAFVGNREFWWVTRFDLPTHGEVYFSRPDVHMLETHAMGGCRLARVVQLPETNTLAVATVAGGPITLRQVTPETAKLGDPLHLVLYWLAESSVTESYTVFTHLVDGAGQTVVQQDNLPVEGLAPTNTWQPSVIIRDPYRLQIPGDLQPGEYQLLIGLYTAAGRQMFVLPDGTIVDHVTVAITVGDP